MTPLAPVRYAYRRTREGLIFLRGKRILQRYSSHYRAGRRVFRRDGHPATEAAYSADSFGIRVVRGADGDPFRLPAGYDAIVERVARAVDQALSVTANCRFIPGLPSAAAIPRTADIPEIADGGLIAMQLLDPFGLDGVRELCEPLLEEIERVIYGSYALVDRLYVYRSPISRQEPKASWRWHYDNHPREILKVMVYLTDVREDTAPFVYLRERSSGRFMPGAPLTPLFCSSRIPTEQIAHHLANGWEEHPVTGRRGTVVIFDDNIVHRATLARAAHRDVIVFQIRPSTFKASPRIDRRWTGTYGHVDFPPNPRDLTPRPSPP
jgi:hypothetical protein